MTGPPDAPAVVTWVRALKAIHTQGVRSIAAGWCSTCNQIRPCDGQRLVEEVERLQAENERLHGLVRQAFDAIDNPLLHKGPKHFTRYPCYTCGGEVSNAGFARKSHERGKVHQAALAAINTRGDFFDPAFMDASPTPEPGVCSECGIDGGKHEASCDFNVFTAPAASRGAGL